MPDLDHDPESGFGAPVPGSVAAEARASVLLADFANVDPAGKLNVIGGNWKVTRRAPVGPGGAAGLPAQTVVVVVEVPPALADEQFALTLALEDATGVPVLVPQPGGGTPAPLRLQQLTRVTPVQAPGVPAGVVPGHAQVIVSMAPGMAVSPGRLYRWVLELDGHRDPRWTASFFVQDEQTPPVLG